MEKAALSPRPIKSDNYEGKAAKKDVRVNNYNIVVEELRDESHDHRRKKQDDDGTGSCATDAASDYENVDDLHGDSIDDADDDDKQKRFKQNLHFLMHMRSARASPLRARAAIYNGHHNPNHINSNNNSQSNTGGAAFDQEIQHKPLDGTKSSGSNNHSKANMNHVMMNVRSSRPSRGSSSLATSSIITDDHHHHHRHHPQHQKQPALSNPSSTEASPRSASHTCNTKSTSQLHRDDVVDDAKPHNVINDNPLYNINTNVTDVNCNNNNNNSISTLMQKQGADHDQHDHDDVVDDIQLSATSSRTSRHHSITDDLIAKARADENKDGSHLMRVLADFLEEFQFGASDDNGEYANWVQDPKSLPVECRHSRQLAGQLRRLADVFEKENIMQGGSCSQAGKDHKLLMNISNSKRSLQGDGPSKVGK